MLCITSDIDWAPDAVVADTLELLAPVRATLFATHETPILRSRAAGQHAIGIHPNFLNTKDFAKEIDRLLDIYPEALGARCHHYYQNSAVLDLFHQRGLEYDSNMVMFGAQGIRGFRHWNGVARLPVFWEDDVNALAGGSWRPDLFPMADPADPEVLYVFNFHPVHVYLNTETMLRYEAAKPYYKDAHKLREFRNPEASGVGTRVFLKRLVDMVVRFGIPTMLMSEAARAVPGLEHPLDETVVYKELG